VADAYKKQLQLQDKQNKKERAIYNQQLIQIEPRPTLASVSRDVATTRGSVTRAGCTSLVPVIDSLTSFDCLEALLTDIGVAGG
jgi:hypothetical protein